MSIYLFETDQFGISDDGFHLLRSKFSYESIRFKDVNEITIIRGRQVNNWIVIFVIGILLFGGGILYGSKLIYEYFFGDTIHLFYIEQFLLPIFPILLGGFAIYSSLKTGFVLKIKYGNKTKNFPIEEIKKKSGIEDLENYFKLNNLTKASFRNHV